MRVPFHGETLALSSAFELRVEAARELCAVNEPTVRVEATVTASDECDAFPVGKRVVLLLKARGAYASAGPGVMPRWFLAFYTSA
jgi:hypothetical protein